MQDVLEIFKQVEKKLAAKSWFKKDKWLVSVHSFPAGKPEFVTFHVLHHAKIPGTKLKRTEIAKPFVDLIYKEVKSWDGYKFRAGKYGTQPFTMILDGTSADFAATLELEVSRMCKTLGPAMDKVLSQVLS